MLLGYGMISCNAADDIWSTKTRPECVGLFPQQLIRGGIQDIGLDPMATQKFDPGEVCNVIQSIVQTLLCGESQ